MKTLKLSTNKSNASGETVEFKVKRVDNGGEEHGKITTPDYTMEYCERWDYGLQEIVIDVTHDGADFCKVYDHGSAYCAIASCASMNISNTNKFKAIVKLAYNTI